jgi:hypothetical protein
VGVLKSCRICRCVFDKMRRVARCALRRDVMAVMVVPNGCEGLGSRTAMPSAARHHVVLAGSRTCLFREVCSKTVEHVRMHFRLWNERHSVSEHCTLEAFNAQKAGGKCSNQIL